MAMDFLLTTYSGFREYPNPNWSIVMQAPEKNLAFDLVRVTESAALSAARWLGKGDKEAGDGRGGGRHAALLQQPWTGWSRHYRRRGKR